MSRLEDGRCVVDRRRFYHRGVGWIRAHRLRAGLMVLVGTLVGVLGFVAAAPAFEFRRIASEEFSPQAAADQIAATEPEPSTTTSTTAPPQLPDDYRPEQIRFAQLSGGVELTPFQLASIGSPMLPDEMFTSVLLIGSDASGALADAIILVLLPEDGSPPVMASLPRDLWLPNRCTGGFTRINATLNGCGDAASGPELLALTVADFTGVEVDHYARVTFSGFANVIDWMGGISVCVDAPTRDIKAHLDIPAGCQTVGGQTALAWVRSRTTEQLIGDEWKLVASSDFSRQAHQQDVLLQLGRKLAAYRSPTSLAEALERLSSAVRLDEGWGLAEIAELGFRYRDLDTDEITRIRLTAQDYRTSGGAWVLLPVEQFNTTLAEVYPPAAR